MKKYKKPELKFEHFILDDIMTVSSPRIDGGSTNFKDSWIEIDIDGGITGFMNKWEL